MLQNIQTNRQGDMEKKKSVGLVTMFSYWERADAAIPVSPTKNVCFPFGSSVQQIVF